MKTYKPKEQKTLLVKAIELALIEANNEMVVLKQHYTEENLRYVVMNRISQVKCFGHFPNINEDDYLLCFQKQYEKNTFKPDIVSMKFRANGKNKIINRINRLVIELKVNAATTASDKKEKTNSKLSKDILKIKKMGSCLSTVLYMVRQYLKRVDDIQFKNGVVMSVGIPKGKIEEPTIDDFARYTYNLEVVLNKHQKEFLKETNSSKNLLFAWYNPLINKPELIWLNQKEKIVLGGNKKK